MSQTPGSSIARVVRLLYGATLGIVLACGFGAYWFWPGVLAWIFLALGALAMAGGVALTQLLARFRMILWLLPLLERLRGRAISPTAPPDGPSRRGRDGR